jgi:hypothetical protein
MASVGFIDSEIAAQNDALTAFSRVVECASQQTNRPVSYFRPVDHLMLSSAEMNLIDRECVQAYAEFFCLNFGQRHEDFGVRIPFDEQIIVCQGEIRDKFESLKAEILRINRIESRRFYQRRYFDELSPAQWQIVITEGFQKCQKLLNISHDDLKDVTPDKLKFISSGGYKLIEMGVLSYDDMRLLPLAYLESLTHMPIFKLYNFMQTHKFFEKSDEQLRDLIAEHGWVNADTVEYRRLAFQSSLGDRDINGLIGYVRSKVTVRAIMPSKAISDAAIYEAQYKKFQEDFEEELRLLEVCNILNLNGRDSLETANEHGLLDETLFVTAEATLEFKLALKLVDYLQAFGMGAYSPQLFELVSEEVRGDLESQIVDIENEFMNQRGAVSFDDDYANKSMCDYIKEAIYDEIEPFMIDNSIVEEDEFYYMSTEEAIEALKNHLKGKFEEWILQMGLDDKTQLPYFTGDNLRNRKDMLKDDSHETLLFRMQQGLISEFKNCGMKVAPQHVKNKRAIALLMERLKRLLIINATEELTCLKEKIKKINGFRLEILNLDRANFNEHVFFTKDDVVFILAYMKETDDEAIYHEFLAKLVELDIIDNDDIESRYENDWTHEALFNYFSGKTGEEIFRKYLMPRSLKFDNLLAQGITNFRLSRFLQSLEIRELLWLGDLTIEQISEQSLGSDELKWIKENAAYLRGNAAFIEDPKAYYDAFIKVQRQRIRHAGKRSVSNASASAEVTNNETIFKKPERPYKRRRHARS